MLALYNRNTLKSKVKTKEKIQKDALTNINDIVPHEAKQSKYHRKILTQKGAEVKQEGR